MNTNRLFLILIAASLGAITTVQANASHFGHPPPKAAVEVCSDKSSGDACAFLHHNREVEGTCFSPADEKPLACRPNRPPAPPSEAIDACTNKVEGEDCSFEHRERAIDGTCRLSPRGEEPLACAPEKPRRHRH